MQVEVRLHKRHQGHVSKFSPPKRQISQRLLRRPGHTSTQQKAKGRSCKLPLGRRAACWLDVPETTSPRAMLQLPTGEKAARGPSAKQQNEGGREQQVGRGAPVGYTEWKGGKKMMPLVTWAGTRSPQSRGASAEAIDEYRSRQGWTKLVITRRT